MQKQSTFGCYHTEAAGLLPNDVHVIDLKEVTNQNTASSHVTIVLISNWPAPPGEDCQQEVRGSRHRDGGHRSPRGCPRAVPGPECGGE